MIGQRLTHGDHGILVANYCVADGSMNEVSFRDVGPGKFHEDTAVRDGPATSSP